MYLNLWPSYRGKTLFDLLLANTSFVCQASPLSAGHVGLGFEKAKVVFYSGMIVQLHKYCRFLPVSIRAPIEVASHRPFRFSDGGPSLSTWFLPLILSNKGAQFPARLAFFNFSRHSLEDLFVLKFDVKYQNRSFSLYWCQICPINSATPWDFKVLLVRPES